MVNVPKGWFTAYIDHVRSGTDRVVQHYFGYMKDRLKYLCMPFQPRDGFGYLTLNVHDLHTYGIITYRQILSDPRAWAMLRESRLMPCFAFDHVKATAEGGAVAEKLKASGSQCNFTGADTPEYFIHVTMACMEARHPGGVGEKIGDEDAFNLVAARGYLLHHNASRLWEIGDQTIGQGLKRIVQCLAMVAGVRILLLFAPDSLAILAPSPIGVASPLVEILFNPASLVCTGATAYIVWQAVRISRRIDAARRAFDHATDQICHTIISCLQKRQDALIAGVNDIVAELRHGDRLTHWAKGKSLYWARVAPRWSLLLDWFERRIDAIQQFAFCSSNLTQMVMPALTEKAKVRALQIRSGFIGLALPLAALGMVGLACRLFMPPSLAGFLHLNVAHWATWQDVFYLGFVTVAGVAARRMRGCLEIHPDPDTMYDVLHCKAFSHLKGPADADVAAKRAKLYEEGHLRDLYNESFGFPPQEDDGEDEADRTPGQRDSTSPDNPHLLM